MNIVVATTPEPPYYAVIFTSLRTEGDHGYGAMADSKSCTVRVSMETERTRETLGFKTPKQLMLNYLTAQAA